MKDAQQQIIDELRLEIASLTKGNETLHKIIDEWTPNGCIRLDDPVVTGLVEALRYVFHERLPLGNTVSDYIFEESLTRWQSVYQALSAYEARVKSIEVPLQNHGHMNIDYKYNNETTTMSPARVKEVGK